MTRTYDTDRAYIHDRGFGEFARAPAAGLLTQLREAEIHEGQVTFRRVGNGYRRHEETHRQQLFEESSVVQILRIIGFRVQAVRSYGDYLLAERVVGFVARKPSP